MRINKLSHSLAVRPHLMFQSQKHTTHRVFFVVTTHMLSKATLDKSYHLIRYYAVYVV